MSRQQIPLADRRGQFISLILSHRQKTVLRLIGKGLTSKEIVIELNLSPLTISTYRREICHKLNVHSTAELVAVATQWLSQLENSDKGADIVSN